MELPTPRRLVLVGLLALLPVAAYVTLQADTLAGATAANVILIVGALYVAFGPDNGHGSGGSTA